MPKRKVREAPPAPRAKPRDRKRVATDSAGSDGPQHSVNLVDLSGPQHSANPVDFPTSPNLNRETMSTQKQPPALNREQLDEVTRAVIAAMSCRAETSHPQNEMTQDASAEYPDHTRIWIVGSSIIKHAFCHARKSCRGTDLQLDRHKASIFWLGKGGMSLVPDSAQGCMEGCEEPSSFRRG
ncbi:uncharacterized protein LOC128164849 [Crassostrea angulata]|uniref:uncharacterized protein LOC128164849 n=1 Tax=Magallana angulata TaxID=2784310 RepID=UPI0022B1FDA9|nr:uncharacterized protein LOC128164849 [Crassostrea angulata]